MNDETDMKAAQPNIALGWLFAPLAVLLALAAMKIVGITYEMDITNLMPMIVVAIAGMLAIVPRAILVPRGISSSLLSLGVLVVSLVGAEALYMFTEVGALASMMFALIVILGSNLDMRGRHEWNTMLTFTSVGLWLALASAGDYISSLETTFTTEGGELVSTLNLGRQAAAYVFFAYFTMFAALGLLIGVFARGIANPAGREGWFSFVSEKGGWNASSAPLITALAVWVLAFAGSLWHFNSVELVDQLRLTTEESYHGYVGYWAAFFTGVVAFIVAAMVAERWFTRAMLTGSMFALYQVSSWYEDKIWYTENLAGTWGALLWLGITFFICVGIYYISIHEKFGGWANRGEHEPSNSRLFLREHGAGLMIALAFIMGLAIRIQWYAVPSMNAFGTGNWDMTGGSDPWYMKRVVDYILANNAHLVVDADRFYPIGGINPRPPLFSWSMAIGAMILEPFLENPEDAVWWSMLALPAIYGALTILPIAATARDHFGKGAAVIAAWLVAFMPAHVTHSTWALADHDAFVMLFISIGFMYWLRAVKYAGTARITKETSANPKSFILAFRDVFAHRQAAMANAILAGVAFGIASLGWKGFVVGPSILFLAYALQVALNMFRRRDSTTMSVMFLTMLSVIFLMALPFYGHPQLSLVLDSTGLQPFLFIFGFTLAIAFVTTGFRDKPWLLVLGTLAGLAAVFFTLLFVLKIAELSDAWDVLFTGSGYFSKTKIFGTVAEANAPNRAQLFASFGPITFLLALVMGGTFLWRGLRHRRSTDLVFGVWVFAATFMAWNAARFMFNATPIMAILGACGIVSLWKWANWSGLVRSWKKFGIRTPADRIAGARKAVWRTPQFSAIFLVMLMLFSQQATYGLDSAIPGSSSSAEGDLDERIYDIMPDIFRFDGLGFSIFDSSNHDGRWYLGNFGSSFNDDGWNKAYEWLADQDANISYSEKPAFVSWWDYGFQALTTGDHPSVSDNFQSGIPATGNMLLARNQDDLTAMFIWQLAEGDRDYSISKNLDTVFTPAFQNVLEKYLTDEQIAEFTDMETRSDEGMIDFIKEHSFQVIKTNRNIVMATGYQHEAGIFDTETPVFRLYKDGVQFSCESETSGVCLGDDWLDENAAESTFSSNIRSADDTVVSSSHTIFGEYWYTEDLVEDYLDVATSIHRKNARIAMVTQLLTAALAASDDATIHDMYHDIINVGGESGNYVVQDYEKAPGETISRDHEIRYFAIDNRLYPRAGRYTADYNYNSGQPMGIFGAPTILSGQDTRTYMDEVYETIRGDFSDEMTREEVDLAMQKDFLNQQSGAEIDPLQIEDVRVDHLPAFFDTMVARTYVGYGASTLGLDTASSNPQPSQHFMVSGSPGSILASALPLPGAMMNHYVIANWYDDETDSGITDSNTKVKILKYYPGNEISGQVTLSDNSEGIPGVRLLIERDAFSGEGPEDLDSDTYWVPIGFVDADENGNYEYTVPAGRIRVSAFAGEYDPIPAQDSIRDGSFAQVNNNNLDITSETNGERDVYAITAILGQVANMTWLGDAEMNVTAAMANREVNIDTPLDLAIQSSGVSGTVVWSGDESFSGDAVSDTTFKLRNIWSMTEDYTVTTTSGSITSEESRILQGTGEATFTENGTFQSEGMAIAKNFIGTFTRELGNDRMFFANGTWDGYGTIEASWMESINSTDCEFDNDSMPIMPANYTVCVIGIENGLTNYRVEGIVNASGTFTSDGITTLTRTYGDYDSGSGDTFEGAGFYEGIGTFNGTGLFIGSGTFSGPMVEPGSFYRTGLLPGTYNMVAMLENNKTVLLPDPVVVGNSPSYDLEMTMPGAIFEDVLQDMDGELMPNQTIEFVDIELGEAFMVEIVTDENASFSYGPIPKGDYYYRVDADNDGWYDLNESATIGDETTNITIGFGVPGTVDVTLNLVSPVDPVTQEPLFNVSNRVITFDNIAGILDPVNVTSDENGLVFAELLYGVYDIRDDVNTDYVLFDQIDIGIGSDDIEKNITYAESIYINGSLRAYPGLGEDYNTWLDLPDADKIETSDAASGVTVEFQSGVLMFTSVTNTTGHYSVRVPAGFDYHMTATSIISNMGGGQLIAVSSSDDMDLGIMYLEPTTMVTGIIYLYENTTRWSNTIPRWVAPEITATNEDGLQWTTTASEMGEFDFDLLDGTWEFNVSEELLNIESISGLIVNRSVTEEMSAMELFANPAAIDISFQIFLNSAEDGSFENGTKVSPEFHLIPLDENRENIYLTAENYTDDGVVNISLTPGTYTLTFNRTTANSENATDYDLIGEISFDDIYIGLDGPEEPLPVPLKETYRVTGTLLNSTGEGIMNDFLLYNEAEDSWFSDISSEENGTFAAYVPAGDWLMIVAPFSNGNVTETLRAPLNIGEDSSARLNKTFTSTAAVNVMVQLKEHLTLVDLADINLVAVSEDGLGNVTFEKTDSNGNASEMLMPGNWSLYLNKSLGQRTWYLNTSATPFNMSSAENGSLILEPVYAELEVEIGGKVYWDLDNSSTPSLDEGLEGFNVTVIGNNNSEVNSVVTTDENGVWRLFVPIQDVYNVTVEKEGFDTVYYMTENESGFAVYNSTQSTDIEVVAGLVEVTGSVTDQVDANRLNGASIVLYPKSGIERDSVTVTGTMVNDSLEWSAMVQPGEWIVVVTDANPTQNGGGVAVGLLDASVSNGGNLSMEMALGGYLVLNTEWYPLGATTPNHAGDDNANANVMSESVVLETMFDGNSWMLDLPATGTVNLLMPEGSISFDSTFMTNQHSSNLDMEYFGGQSMTVASDSTITAVLEYNRRVNSALDLAFNSVEGANLVNSSDITIGALVSSTNDSIYDEFIFSVDVTYNGTESMDVFTVTAEMGLGQDSDLWTVELYNETSEEWESSVLMSLGIGNATGSDAILTDSVSVRVTLPSVEDAWHLDNGHRVSVRLETESGEASQITVKAVVPSDYDYVISDATELLGISPLVQRRFSFDIANTGNGKDTFSLELLESGIPEGWSVTPMNSNVTLEKDKNSIQLFTVFAPEDFSDGEGFDLKVYVVNLGGDAQEVDVTIQYAQIKLKVDSGEIAVESDDIANVAGNVVVPVQNEGLLDATSVIVYLRASGDEEWFSQTISVPAGQTVNAEFDNITREQGDHRFEIRMEVAGEEANNVEEINLPGTPDDNGIHDFKLRYDTATVADGDSIWITIAVIILGLLVVYGGVKTARSGRSGSKF